MPSNTAPVVRIPGLPVPAAPLVPTGNWVVPAWCNTDDETYRVDLSALATLYFPKFPAKAGDFQAGQPFFGSAMDGLEWLLKNYAPGGGGGGIVRTSKTLAGARAAITDSRVIPGQPYIIDFGAAPPLIYPQYVLIDGGEDATHFARIGEMIENGLSKGLFTVDVVAGTLAPYASGVAGYTKDEVNDLLDTKGSEAVQQQHTQQLATLGVQGSPVYGYLNDTNKTVVGYTSIDDANADIRAKLSIKFNVAILTQNVTNSNGFALYMSGEGNTLRLGANVNLNLPGDDIGSLYIERVYIEQAPSTRGGRVAIFSTAPDTTPAALLPRLDVIYCGVTLELKSGGTVALSGSYSAIAGTGTVVVIEPFDVDAGSVGPGIKLVRQTGGGVDAFTKQETQALLQLKQNEIDILNQNYNALIANGGPKIIEIPFDAGTTNNFTTTITPTRAFTYKNIQVINVDSYTIRRNGSSTGIPLVLAAGDVLYVEISRTDLTKASTILLTY